MTDGTQPPVRRSRKTPSKLGQSSRMPKLARSILDRLRASGRGAPPDRAPGASPRSVANHPVGSTVKLAEDTRRATGWRQRTMTVVACPCAACADGRWVAVDVPHPLRPLDTTDHQHYACVRLRRAGKKEEVEDAD